MSWAIIVGFARQTSRPLSAKQARDPVPPTLFLMLRR